MKSTGLLGSPLTAWAAAACVAVGTAAVFLPAVRCGFVSWDDPQYVSTNADVALGLTPQTVWRAVTTVTFLNWAPLTTLSYLLDATAYGIKPWGFHLTNVLIHAVASGMIMLAIARLTGDLNRSLAATLLFAIHPLRVESVAWIAERKDVLSVLFLGATLLAYEAYCRRPTWLRYAAVLGAMAVSLLAKATLITLPVLLLLLDAWPLRRIRGRGTGSSSSEASLTWQRALLEKAPLFLLSAVFSAVTLGTQAAAIKEHWRLPVWSVRLPLGLWSVIRYLGMTVWPAGLHPAYCHPGSAGATPLVTMSAVLGIAVMAIVAAVAWRRIPAVSVGLGWYVVALLPVLGIVKQQGFQSHADRFTYVPHVGLAIAVVWWFADVVKRLRLPRSTGAVACTAVLALFVVADERLIAQWRDDTTLWSAVLAVDPENPVANRKEGIRLMASGDFAQAKQRFLRALQWLVARPQVAEGEDGDVCARLARISFDEGDYETARRYRDRALAADPDGEYTRWVVKYMRAGPRQERSGEVKRLLRDGLEAARAGRANEAIETFQRALAADPDCAEAQNNLGLAFSITRRPADAVTALRRAVAINPHNADYRLNLALALENLGDRDAARQECAAAIEIDPTDVEIQRLSSRISASRASPP